MSESCEVCGTTGLSVERGLCADCAAERAREPDTPTGLDELEARVRAWCDDVGLPPNPRAQLEKLREEVDELEDALDSNLSAEEVDADEVWGELGDVQVTMFALARALATTSARATRPVVEKIEERAEEGGATVDGQYVKESDLDEERGHS